MLDKNADRILQSLAPDDVVLDIGGWARPFNRANFVLDAEPFETRGYYGASKPAQGGPVERFTAERWIRRDICEHSPFPFADKSLDYVMCSHVLEDIRDPLWVCAEMIRIAKRGYIEVPSRRAESSRGTEPGQVGWSHHRWLIDIHDGRIDFLMKYHRIHSHWRLSFPSSFLRGLHEDEQVQWLFWDDTFSFGETTIHGVDNIERTLANYVHGIRPYNPARLQLDRAASRVARLASRVINRLRR
jgi:SAM-dependent methyltransferase